MLLEKKVAVVTGTSSGIGKAIAEVFLKNNATVIGLDIVEDNDRILKENFTFYKMNVSNIEDCNRVYHEFLSSTPSVDILVNCAGITKDSMTKKMTEVQFDEVIAVNLKGVWNITRLIGPKMQDQKHGSIVNISSVVGIQGNVGQVNYAAAKAGIIGMTRSWAREFSLNGGNVRVNAIAPGYTMTNMLNTVPQALLDKFTSQTMLGRLAKPDEIANVVLFLASDLSSYITGEVINVNGGIRL